MTFQAAVVFMYRWMVLRRFVKVLLLTISHTKVHMVAVAYMLMVEKVKNIRMVYLT